jgi:exodeoxyribonuclease VII small subunit
MAEKKRAPSASESVSESSRSFEDALERLETLVDELEGGGLSLEQSIAHYEEGLRLSKQLGAKLDEAEKRIERLVEAGSAEEPPRTEPMELEERGEPAEPEGRLPL